MYAIKDNTVVKIDCKEVIRLGVVDDKRVERLELHISKHYRIGVQDLNTFYKDTDAKLMLCFLLHDWFNYSVASIAGRYNIYPAFLQKNITEHYHKCLLSEEFFKLYNSFKAAFFYEVKTEQPAIN